MSMIPEIILIYIFSVLSGTLSLWILIKLFSAGSMDLKNCLPVVAIVEFIALFKIPFLPFLALWFMMTQIGEFSGISAFFAAAIYQIIKISLIGILAVAIFM